MAKQTKKVAKKVVTKKKKVAKVGKKVAKKTAKARPGVTAKGAKTAKVAKGLDVGAKAPTFSLPTDSGALDLSSFQGKKNVVLYFYPKDDTPGCTVQACTFEEHNSHYEKLGSVVIGVSADSAQSHAKFRTKYKLSFPLVVDEGAKLANKYGVWVEKNNYGRKYMGIQRTTFLIDKQGKIARVWPKVKVEGHSDQVLEALRSLD